MGLDWRHLSLSAYLEALEAHNEAHDPEASKRSKGSGKPANPEALSRFLRAHSGG